MVMTKEQAIVIRDSVQEALNGLNISGVAFEVGRTSYNFVGTGTLKVSFAHVTDEGVVETPERIAFIKNAFSYGLNPSDIDKTFIDGMGVAYKITGLKPRRHKYPVSGTRLSDGKPYKFSEFQVQRGLPGGENG